MVEERSRIPAQISKKLQQVIDAFEKNRDNLLDVGKELVVFEAGGWTEAEILFEIAKRTDLIRLDLKKIIEDPTNEGLDRIETKASGSTSETESRRRSHVKKRKEDYPKYSVRGETLVKVGLSRDMKTEYEHLVSKPAFAAVLTRLMAFMKVDEFVAEELQEELDVPSYQTYIVLAVMRELGVLDSPRRGVYTFRGLESESLNVDTIWHRVEKQ
jgi:hypothetical protein